MKPSVTHQNCGRSFRIQPVKLRLVLGILLTSFLLIPGLLITISLMLIAQYRTLVWEPVLFLVLPGIALGFWCSRPWRTLRRFPVVEGASVPTLRFRLTEPWRRCRCGNSLRCEKITKQYFNGIYTGTEAEYRCELCPRSFTISNLWSGVFHALLTIFLLGVALIIGRGGWLFYVLLILGGLFLLAAFYPLLSRQPHPIVPAKPDSLTEAPPSAHN